MTSAGQLLLINAGAIAALMVAVWLLSLVLRDASIVDSFWGLGFVMVAWVSFATGDGWGPRSVLIAGLVTIWGLRLTTHVTRRNWGSGEDFRYVQMRKRWGSRFWLISLATVFLLQGAIMWIVSLPVQLAQVSPQPDHITVLDLLGVLAFAVGFLFEAVGDAQLERFKKERSGSEAVLDTGLWAYTRHPNYFGDALQWFGFFLICASHVQYGWTIVSPVMMTFFLMKVSGVPMLERAMVERKPGYADYMERTSAFFPRRPRKPA